MYSPAFHRWDDEKAALKLAGEWNFGALITIADGAPLISHLPLLVDGERRVLRGHLARANPHAEKIDGAEHLAVFTGPNAYISPDWYGEGGKDVPTWNYLAVHVRGKARVLADAAAIDAFLADLSAHEEARRTDLADGRMWTIDKVPPDQLARMRSAIVAFEIDIMSVQAKAKLSQNKKPEAVEGVIGALLESGLQMNEALALFMSEARRS